MDSHQHGLAELRLLLEEQRIEIEFESPAFNLVGFEHKTSNPEEKSLVRNVEANFCIARTINVPERWRMFPRKFSS